MTEQRPTKPAKRVPGRKYQVPSTKEDSRNAQHAIRNTQPSLPTLSGHPSPQHSEGERLQKILARAGIASRRAAEELIAAGRVTVNGAVVREMGVRADVSRDKIAVDGRPLAAKAPQQAQEYVYIALNKPTGVVSTAKDTHGRSTVLDLVRKPGPEGSSNTAPHERIYPVGRLDADTTGLLLLTNDGDLTFRLTHPRYGVEKEYIALVRGRPTEDALRRLREGVEIEGEMTAPAKVEWLDVQENQTRLRITIHEGRKRQVRLMLAAIGHQVVELRRVRFGPIMLGNLEQGKWRYLATHEVHALRKAVKLSAGMPIKRDSKKGSKRGER